MRINFTQVCSTLLLLGGLVSAGCSGNTGVVQAPAVTAEEQAASEARQADYEKAMEKSMNESRGN